MSSDMYETKWMMRLLDYEHWRVFHLGIELGQIVINHADQSVTARWFDDVPRRPLFDIPRGYRAARAWLREHEREY